MSDRCDWWAWSELIVDINFVKRRRVYQIETLRRYINYHILCYSKIPLDLKLICAFSVEMFGIKYTCKRYEY